MSNGFCLSNASTDYVKPEQTYQPNFPRGASQPIDGPIGSSDTKLDAIQTTHPPAMKQTFKSMMGLDASAEYITAVQAYEKFESTAIPSIRVLSSHCSVKCLAKRRAFGSDNIRSICLFRSLEFSERFESANFLSSSSGRLDHRK